MSNLFSEQMNYLHGLAHFTPSKVVSGEYKMELEAIGELLSLTGNPEKKLQIIHVAGTNGKGSTIALLSQILIEAGYRVGVYTSPALLRVTEQIRINNDEISENDFAEGILRIRPFVDQMISKGHKPTTEFETITVMAFNYFLEKSCDIVLLECGLGGRTDATNVVASPILSVITSIGLDHTEILGDTLTKIAYEKAGIIKKNGTAVVAPSSDDVIDVFRNKCDLENAKLIVAKLEYSPENNLINNASIGLKGDYQKVNATVALACVRELQSIGFNITDTEILAGLANASWPCRFEIINSSPIFVIDGAHNIDGINALKNSLTAEFPGRKFKFIVGVLKDKSYQSMMNKIIPIASSFYTVTVPSQRALSAEDLCSFLCENGADAQPFTTIENAISTAIADSTQGDVICVFGSLYYAGIARDIIKKLLFQSSS